MSNLSDAKPAVSDEDMKAAVSNEEDHLYWKAYGAGIVFVIISLTQFQGCLFYTCQVALTLSLSLCIYPPAFLFRVCVILRRCGLRVPVRH